MAKYTAKEAKQWARGHMVGCTNAPTTPFKDDFSLDLEALAFNVNKYAEVGLYGLMTGGNMAEAWNMTPTEWYQYTETCAKAADGRMMLTSVILDPSPFTVIEKAEVLDGLGYDLLEVINPVIQLRSDEDVYGYFKYLNDNQPLGIVLYQTPNAGYVMNHGLINRLADLDKVVGIKNGMSNPADTIALRKMAGDRMVVTEPMESFYLWDSIVHGAQCIFGTLEVLIYGHKRETLFKMMDLAAEGDFAAALPLHRELEPLRDLMVEVFLMPLIEKKIYNLAPVKYWLDVLGYKMGACRPPVAPFCEDSVKQRIRDVLIDTGAVKASEITVD